MVCNFHFERKGLRERNRYPGEFYKFSDQKLNERDCYGFRYVIYVCENHDSQDLEIYNALSLKFHFIYNMFCLFQDQVRVFTYTSLFLLIEMWDFVVEISIWRLWNVGWLLLLIFEIRN